MQPLISLSDFAGYADIAQSLDEIGKLEPYIGQAQKHDLRAVLGEALFHDFIQSPESPDPPYATLLAGGTYVVDGIDIAFEGVKPALVYRAYARYLVDGNNAESTSHGFREKLNEYSKPISDGKEVRKINYARSLAEAEEANIVRYLDANASSFPLWKTNCSVRKRNGNGAVRMRAIDPLDCQ